MLDVGIGCGQCLHRLLHHGHHHPSHKRQQRDRSENLLRRGSATVSERQRLRTSHHQSHLRSRSDHYPDRYFGMVKEKQSELQGIFGRLLQLYGVLGSGQDVEGQRSEILRPLVRS